jgi:LRR receptor-like serine/threonine-protein kinase ERECTA
MNRIGGMIPRTLKQWTAMRELRLSGNQLQCDHVVLQSLQYLTCLEVLDLSFNDLSGPLPNVFSSLPSLEVLNLAGNSFHGPIPNSLTSLVNLKELKLFCNQLTGGIPVGFSGQHRYLRVVNLSQNFLSQGISAFNDVKALETLALNNNQLCGNIDDSIGQLCNLTTLHLQRNQLTGVIPDQICALQKLKFLDLSHNHLRGCLPDRIGELQSLEKLLLIDNALIGPLPQSIASLSQSLRDFRVFRPYPAEISMPPNKFDRYQFERVYGFGPAMGVDSVNWDPEVLYGVPKEAIDAEDFSIFSQHLSLS